jgi:4'-phosphopantetheinyl transferase
VTAVVHVRWARPDAADEPVAWLDPTERDRLGRLSRPEDRARFVTSRALLKDLVGTLSRVPASAVGLGYDCSQCGQPHGRPYLTGALTRSLVGAPWPVSIAHAGDRVLVAVSAGDAGDAGGPEIAAVGVDVEPVAAVGFAGFAEVALTAREMSAIAALPSSEQQRARATAWVRKEARLKASGDGLRVDPREVDTTVVAAGCRVVDLAVGDGYVAAVAVLGALAVRVDLAERGVSPERPAGPGAPASRATAAVAR